MVSGHRADAAGRGRSGTKGGLRCASPSLRACPTRPIAPRISAACGRSQPPFSSPLASLHRLGAAAGPIRRIKPRRYARAKAGERPIGLALRQTVLDRVQMNVIHVSRAVAIIADRVPPPRWPRDGWRVALRGWARIETKCCITILRPPRRRGTHDADPANPGFLARPLCSARPTDRLRSGGCS